VIKEANITNFANVKPLFFHCSILKAKAVFVCGKSLLEFETVTHSSKLISGPANIAFLFFLTAYI